MAVIGLAGLEGRGMERLLRIAFWPLAPWLTCDSVMSKKSIVTCKGQIVSCSNRCQNCDASRPFSGQGCYSLRPI